MKSFVRKVFIYVLYLTIFTNVSLDAYGAQSIHFTEHPLENVRGGPSEGLLDVLKLCGIKTTGSWENIIKMTRSWVVLEQNKKDGIWPVSCHCKDMHAFYNALSMLHMTQIVPSCLATYDYAVILGGTLPSIRRRLWFLKQEWERGVRFRHLVFLSGERKLYKNQEDEEDFINPSFNPYPISEDWAYNNQLPKNERDVAEFVWRQMKLPEDWASRISVSFMTIDIKNRKEKVGESLKELLPFWASKISNPGTVLFVSSQPFIELDSLTICKTLKDYDMRFDIVGPGFSSVVLDHSWTLSACCSILAEWIEEARGKRNCFFSK